MGFSLLLAIVIYLYVTNKYINSSLQIIRLTQFYALTAVTYLYFALLASPLYMVFPKLPTKGWHLVARRAIGVSAFFFALTHASLAFFGLIGGFPGLRFLSLKYLIAISCSFTALLILSAMAATSFNFMVKKLGKKWKMLHRLVYLAALLITIHALLLGSNFQNLSGTIPQIFLSALIILLVLESIRLYRWLSKFLPNRVK